MMQKFTQIKKSNSRKEVRRIVVAVNIIIFGLIMAPMVAFAQPLNDDFDYATVIESLPFTDSISTIDATSRLDDASIDDPISTCVSEQGHTVWYTFTPSSDMRFEVNTFESDYDTVLSIYTGSRGSLNEIICNDDARTLQSRVRFDASADTTYYIMVGSFYGNVGNGNLVLTADVAPPSPPPLTIDIDIDPTGSVNSKTKDVTISGTLTSSRPVFADIYIELKQKVGRQIIHGYSSNYLQCNGETPWMATITGYDGVFAGGKATVNVYVNGFDEDEDEYFYDEASKTVQLKGKKK